MERPNECIVPGALTAVLHLLRLVGAAPLCFQKQSNGWRIILAPRLYKISCFIFVPLSIAVMWTVVEELRQLQVIPSQLGSITNTVTLLMQAIIVLIIVLILVLGSSTRMRNTMAVVSQVQKINYKLTSRHWPTQQKQTGLFIIWVTYSGILFIIDFVVKNPVNSNSDVWLILAFYLYNCYFLIIQLGMAQVILIVMHVRSSFSTINDCLRSLLRGNSTSSKSHQEIVRGITSAYVSACDVVRDVNRFFGLFLLMLAANSFFHLIISPYFLINSLFKNGTFVIYEIYQVFWCVYHVLNLVMYIEPCHLTQKEVESTRDLVSRLMQRTCSTYDPLAGQLDQFCRQLVLNEVSYKPLDVITLERSLAITILGNITTYLVILIQMK